MTVEVKNGQKKKKKKTPHGGHMPPKKYKFKIFGGTTYKCF